MKLEHLTSWFTLWWHGAWKPMLFPTFHCHQCETWQKFPVSIFSDQDDFPLFCPWQTRVLSQIISKIPLFFPWPLPYFISLWKREREESISIECDWHECCTIRIWVHFCQFSLPWVREVTLESNSAAKQLD